MPAQTLGHWLARADQARFVVTTREVLGLPGEVVLALPPLPPADGAALFVQRAEAAKPDFQPNAEDQSAIAPLVALLDGLPLAIELAAARVRVMPPRMLLLRMSERFKLLASKGGRLDRQVDAARRVRLVVGPAADRREGGAGATVGVRRRLHARGRRGACSTCRATTTRRGPWMPCTPSSTSPSCASRGDDRFDLLVSVQVYAAEHLQTEGRYPGSGRTGAGLRRSSGTSHGSPRWGRFAPIEGGCADLDNLVDGMPPRGGPRRWSTRPPARSRARGLR